MKSRTLPTGLLCSSARMTLCTGNKCDIGRILSPAKPGSHREVDSCQLQMDQPTENIVERTLLRGLPVEELRPEGHICYGCWDRNIYVRFWMTVSSHTPGNMYTISTKDAQDLPPTSHTPCAIADQAAMDGLSEN